MSSIGRKRNHRLAPCSTSDHPGPAGGACQHTDDRECRDVEISQTMNVEGNAAAIAANAEGRDLTVAIIHSGNGLARA